MEDILEEKVLIITNRFFSLITKIEEDFYRTKLDGAVRFKWENMNLEIKNVYFERNLFTSIRKMTNERIITRQNFERNIRYLEHSLLDYIYYLFAAGLDGINWKRWCSWYAQLHVISSQYYEIFDDHDASKYHLFSAAIFSSISDNTRILNLITRDILPPSDFSRMEERVVLTIIEGHPQIETNAFPFGHDNWSLLLEFVIDKDEAGIEAILKIIAEEEYDMFELGKYSSGDPSFNPLVSSVTAYLRFSGLLNMNVKKLKKPQRTVLSAGLLSDSILYDDEHFVCFN